MILGIDPGTTTGYGVIVRGGDGALSLRECGVVRTDAGSPLTERLRRLYEGVDEVVERHRPDVLAVEGVFYARNARTTLLLGHMRGAVLLSAALRSLDVAEYSPAEVKNAVVGTGRATKEQVQYMVQRLLRLKSPPRPADAADAVAVALCHCQAAGLSALVAAGAVNLDGGGVGRLRTAGAPPGVAARKRGGTGGPGAGRVGPGPAVGSPRGRAPEVE